MIEKVVGYGCSFMQGDSVAPESVWASLLAKKLNVPLRNRGQNAGSNKLAMNYLFEDVCLNIELSNDDYSKTLVLFSWTGIQRTTFWSAVKEYKKWIPVLPGHTSGDTITRNISEAYYADLYTEYDALHTSYVQKLSVQSFLKSRNIPYLFVNAFKEDFILYNDFTMKTFAKQLETESFLFGIDGSIYQKICLDLKMVAEDNFHPSVEGHEYLANEAYNFLIGKNII
jgi:lysophospholipase L1-like esterase